MNDAMMLGIEDGGRRPEDRGPVTENGRGTMNPPGSRAICGAGANDRVTLFERDDDDAAADDEEGPLGRMRDAVA